jgi:nucleoside-diphosphate kinase
MDLLLPITKEFSMFIRSLILAVLSFNLLSAERTLSIIKPDAVEANHIGEIVHTFENAGLHLVGAKMLCITQSQAEEFYSVHKEKPFYPDLVKFISSGPSILLVLEGDDAIAKNRELMGATDPKKAAPGTIRQRFAKSIDANAVHGSDSPETAKKEILFFFKDSELCQPRQ